jgi:hypothetical protein
MALPNPALWYKFEDDLIDSSGNGYTGIIFGAHTGSLQWDDMDNTKVGRAVGPQPFTGSYSPCVGTPYRGYHGTGKIWTVNIWVKTHVEEYANSSYFICAFGDYYNAAILQVIYAKTLQKVYVNTYNVSTYMTDVIDKESEVMLTYRYNGDEGASSTIDCFVNGQYYITHNVGQNILIWTSDYYCIAGGENGHGNFLCGNLVGDFRWYESDLSNSQISELYSQFLPDPFRVGSVSMSRVIIGG